MLAEQQTEWIISNNLVNKGWHIDNDIKKNVYFQKPKSKTEQTQLNGKRPDYILYQSNSDKPIAIIEAKKAGVDLRQALEQATEYAKLLDAPIVFAMNGAYCEARFVPNNKELILNGEEVRELLREKEILAFLDKNSNEAWTIPKEVKVSRDELISIFKNLNNILRSEGLRAGIERFSEFANILFLKLLSENNEKSWWNTIKVQSNDDIIGYINSYVIEQIKTKYGGDVFTPISIGNPQTLRHIIDAIDPLILSTIDSDIKGDAFEYFLEKTTSTENDLGEYFTPRNVVKTIINLVDPKFKETIYDPFCGTGGFLTEAFNYIKENNIINTEKDLEKLKFNTLYGRELTKTARIAKMNMILHGDGHSGIQQINSLENPDYIEQSTNQLTKFDIIITNMPFSQTITKQTIKNGKTITENHIAPLYYNGIAKNNGDAACVLHCLQNLKEGGKMALVVPEGFLFRKDIAKVRQFLLSKARLQTVISLPQGTFLPYTGVKTDILYFTDAHKPNRQKDYWFFEAKNIGVTLDNKKRKINGINDFNKIDASDIRKIDKNPDLKANMLELGFEVVDLEKVKNNNYNLVGNGYREIVKGSEWCEIVRLSNVLETCESGSRPKGGIDYREQGAVSIGGEQIGNDGKLNLSKIPCVALEFYQNTKQGKVKDQDILMCKDGALTGKVCIIDVRTLPQKEVMINEHVYIFRGKTEVINQSYLFYCLNSDMVQSQIKNLAYNKSAQPGLNKDHIDAIHIPVPSLEEQQKIVEELDSYQKMIGGAKQIIDNWKPFFEIDKNWEYTELSELIDFIRGFSYKSTVLAEKGIPMYNLKSVKKDLSFDYSFKFVNSETKIQDKYKCFKGELLIAITDLTPTSEIISRATIVNKEGIFSMDLAKIRIKTDVILSKYLYYILNSEVYLTNARKFSVGNNVKHLNLNSVLSIRIPLPALNIQQEIIEQIEKEYQLIEIQKEVIKIFENKLKTRLDSLWQLA